jgi:HTTM domain
VKPRRLYQCFEDFLFLPQSPIPIALFRILYGICVCATVLLLRPDWLDWYGVHGWVSRSAVTVVEPGARLNLFAVLPQDDRWIAALCWIFLGFAILLTIGLWTRISSAIVFLCVASIQQRNLLITHGGDTFLRVAGFFLIFAPAGAALSIDRMIQVRNGKQPDEAAPQPPWAQRMIQFQLAFLYIVSFWWKLKGHAWLDGTALYYVTHLREVQRFPIPGWLKHPATLRLGSWLTLALEFSLGVLIWLRPIRYWLLLAGLLFHLCLEYAMNIPMFQWDVLTAYVLFLDPEDLKRLWRGIRVWIGRGDPATVLRG